MYPVFGYRFFLVYTANASDKYNYNCSNCISMVLLFPSVVITFEVTDLILIHIID